MEKQRRRNSTYISGRRIPIPSGTGSKLSRYMSRNFLSGSMVSKMCIPDINGNLPHSKTILNICQFGQGRKAGALLIESISRILKTESPLGISVTATVPEADRADEVESVAGQVVDADPVVGDNPVEKVDLGGKYIVWGGGDGGVYTPKCFDRIEDVEAYITASAPEVFVLTKRLSFSRKIVIEE